MRIAAVVLAAASVSFVTPRSVLAADFYAGKTITTVVSTQAGDAYDAVARLLLRHMPKFIPGNPNTVVQNMPGGGYLIATNYMHNIAPKDGATIATVNQGVLLHQTFGVKNVQYDMRNFNWLGSYGSRNGVVAVWHTAGVKTIDDLRRKEIIVGASTGGASSYGYALVMNGVLGTKFKIVKGYPGSTGVMLAMERGEVQARTGGYTTMLISNGDWIRDGKIVFVASIGVGRDPDLPQVPAWIEAAETDEQRDILKLISAPIAIGYPFLAPPDVPADRVAILRRAFDATMADKAFRADADKQQVAAVWSNAAKVAEIIRATLASSPEVVAKAKAVMAE